MNASLIPDSAPFTPEQRAWLNGFLNGVLGMLDTAQPSNGLPASNALVATAPTPAASAAEDHPWHDPSLSLDDRLALAQDRPLEHRLMASMAQLDCGTCGYLCHSYAAAIAGGKEKNLKLCSPGGADTAKSLRRLMQNQADGHAAAPAIAAEPAASSAAPGTRANPVQGKLLVSRPLNGVGSAKDTRHVEIDLTGTGLTYRVGDALGIFPENCPALVERVCAAAQWLGSMEVMIDGERTPLSKALARRCLRTIPSDWVAELAKQPRASATARRMPVAVGTATEGQATTDPSTELAMSLEEFAASDRLDDWDVAEFLEFFGDLAIEPQSLVDHLEPLRPRLYSIASSQSVHPTQVHLTVGRVEQTIRARPRKGVASTMLADRLETNSPVSIFVQPSHGFTIPADPRSDMIMVGPGTGIAPFMAFLQQRRADAAPGRNWLFFGDQSQAADFLYRSQLEAWRDEGLLTRLDTAFSRDQAEKIYVQHRMEASGDELFQWLEGGASFFVCGDAARMAADVDRALHRIIAQHGHMTDAAAKEYVQGLTRTRRYARDVY